MSEQILQRKPEGLQACCESAAGGDLQRIEAMADDDVATEKPPRNWHNPLAILGGVFLGGGGPLLAAYTLSSNLGQAWLFAGALTVFVLGMGVLFGIVLIKFPRHFYHPGQIPRDAYDRPLYGEPSVGVNAALAEGRMRIEERSVEELKSVVMRASEQGAGKDEEGLLEQIRPVVSKALSQLSELQLAWQLSHIDQNTLLAIVRCGRVSRTSLLAGLDSELRFRVRKSLDRIVRRGLVTCSAEGYEATSIGKDVAGKLGECGINEVDWRQIEAD